jgi:hypothetical protein
MKKIENKDIFFYLCTCIIKENQKTKFSNHVKHLLKIIKNPVKNVSNRNKIILKIIKAIVLLSLNQYFFWSKENKIN